MKTQNNKNVIEELELIFPTEEYKNQVEKYKIDMLNAGSKLNGCSELEKDDFDTWLKKCKDWEIGKNLPEGYNPATQYICIRKTDNKIIGMFNLIHRDFGGHLGYSIAPDERKKGYGTRLLALGLQKCKEKGYDKALCYVRETNTGSKKCILNNGGELETTIKREEDGVVLEKYWIYLGEK